MLDEQARHSGPTTGRAAPHEATGGQGPEPGPAAPTLARVMDRLTAAPGLAPTGQLGEEVAARLGAEVAREEAAHQAATRATGQAGALADPGAGPGGGDPWIDGFAPLFPLQPPRTG
ncbi:hypothetical protein AB4Z54_74985, partial [Streptomyces sp. MCAF7]